ncbi:hypothetical protein AB0465_11365 [Streptomyces griseoviridis]|uniref:hypothetical protein n=1 Tax=Streptomyces griseoviridis TaxID=45398 RepID=UPI00344B4B74
MTLAVTHHPEPDEERVRYLLARLGARPVGHTVRTSMHRPVPRPVTPTRIIPAGAPLPARPPEAGEIPPWRAPQPAPPAAPPPPPPPAPVTPTAAPPPPPPTPPVVHHVHQVVLVPPEDPPPPRLWARLWDALVTWRLLGAVLLALLPWLGGRSPVSAWGHTVHQARTEAGILAAYVTASLAVTLTWLWDRQTKHRRFLPRFAFVTALLGSLGVLSWVDPITLLTGVTP